MCIFSNVGHSYSLAGADWPSGEPGEFPVAWQQGWTGNRAYRVFSRWADALKGPTESFFFFFAKDHHAGTTSSQWPIGFSPALTA